MSDADHRLTHLDDEGHPRMVDVTQKATTHREAVARGWIRMSDEAYELLQSGENPKGDVFQVARIAAITGGKKTADLIPLCHGLPGVTLEVDVEPDDQLPGVRIRAKAIVSGQTGVEMEAITAVSIGLATVYDMIKAVDRSMEIGGIHLVSKLGGVSGKWSAEEEA